MLRILSLVAIAFLALPLTGCWEYDLFSWSPDGRYLVFVDPNDGTAWRWDTVKQKPEVLHGLKGAEIVRFEFLSNREAIVLGGHFKSSSFFSAQYIEGLIKLNIKDGYLHEVPPGVNIVGFAVTHDRRQILTVGSMGDNDERHAVWIAPVDDVNKKRMIAEFEEQILMPSLDSTGQRLLLVKVVPETELPEGVQEGAEIILIEFDDETASTRSLVRSFESFPINPRWVGDDAIIYTALYEEMDDDSDEEGVGELMLYSFGNDEPEVLHDRTVGYFRASLSPDRTTVLVTVPLRPRHDVLQLSQSSIQLMTINLETREKTILTDEPFGAYAAKFHPTKNRVAYATGEDPTSVRILDLDTGKRQAVWRNEEERLYSAAERFVETGDTGLAYASFDELLYRFPETDYRSRVAYRRMNLHLESPINEFDEAVVAFMDLEPSQLGSQARPLLWQFPNVEANDPEGDLLRRYATEASQAEFEQDTDRTRDLTGLAARLTATRLYLSITFDSAFDLGGAVFQDLVLLFHEVGSTDGIRSVTPSVDWEYPATRRVVVRHWHESGKIYDLDVLDETGGTIAKLSASGIEAPSLPLFDVFHLSGNPNDDSGTVMYWIDHRALGLHPEKDYRLQVCTVKGGIESYKGVERPRELSGWDIADAFGDGNTKTRIDTEAANGTKSLLRGYATTIRVPANETD